MSDLENQVENTEEVASIAEEPTKGAEKGDKSAHSQGSSSEEKIESGKAEVVKPDENPVDKAVAAAKKAGDGTKPVSDAVNKGAEKGDSKAEKIKEDEDSESEDTIVEKGASKMENIKAAVDSMKGLTKEELTKLFSSLSEDEVDESLTKAEVARNIVEALKALSNEEVAKFVKSLGEEEDCDDDDDDDDDEDEAEESVKEEAEAEVESSLVEIEIDDDLSKISESLDLSEENAEKAKTIFKAAVNSKVEEVKKELEEHYQTELKSQVETVKEELTGSVDKYLTYCAEEWTKENELAIERGLRSEMTENFIQGLKTLFVEHYVEVPEDKYDVMDELANRLDEMEAKLDAEVSKNMEISEELGSLKRQNVVTKACEDLSESQTEKMVSLSNGVDFTDEADFEEKVAEIKEAYFGVDSESIAEETISEEGNGDFEEKSEKVLSPEIARYSEALTKLKPLG
tara:strand:- start:206 stop:1579 length:1374 start_codon:yes stop_codon:yes gene_type:complete